MQYVRIRPYLCGNGVRNSISALFFFGKRELYSIFATENQHLYHNESNILRISTVLLFLVASAGMALAEVKEIVLVKTPYEHIDDYPIGK